MKSYRTLLRAIIIFAAGLALIPCVLANGGPVDGSSIVNAGNIQLMSQKDISAEEEFLSIELDGDFANVHVEYVLKNNGEEQIVRYGFPVNFLKQTDLATGWQDEYLPFFKIMDGEKALPVDTSIDKKTYFYQWGKNKIESQRKWFLTNITFPANQEKRIVVDYKVKNFFEDWEFSKSFFAEYDDRTFTYTFIPASAWGNGIIPKLSIQINTLNLRKSGAKLKKINFPMKQDERGFLCCEFKDFQPAKAKDLEIIYDVSGALKSQAIRAQRIPEEDIAVSSSSTLSGGNYGVNNLLDDRLDTAWAEGSSGNGTGEWIEVKLKKKYQVRMIGLINGYTKNETTYYANNRIKKIKLTMEVRRFDEDKPKTETREEVIEFKDGKYASFNPKSFADFMEILLDGYSYIAKLRLTILEVYPGTKYQDTCVSEFYLAGYKMPEE